MRGTFFLPKLVYSGPSGLRLSRSKNCQKCHQEGNGSVEESSGMLHLGHRNALLTAKTLVLVIIPEH